MASGINIYSVFQISEINILDIKNNNFRYQKMNIYFGYPELLFWISEIVIFLIFRILFLDIRNSCVIIVDIQNTFLDITNS